MRKRFRYKFTLVLLLGLTPFLVFAKKVKHEKRKTITKSFVVTSESEVIFDHRRGELEVQYIDGNEARVEASVIVKGEDDEDVQTILDAIDISIDDFGGRIDINTDESIKSWNTSSGWFWTKYKLVLKNGTEITSKVEQITINAILYLPRVNTISLSSKYDDIEIESCKANQLNVNVYSGVLKANGIDANAYIEIKYGKLDLHYVGDLTLDSHDSKGSVGNINNLVIRDKYSDIQMGNANSLHATLHDSDLSMGNVSYDVIIKDKYSEIQLGNVASLNANLHDSNLFLGNVVGDADIIDKYSEVNLGHMENGKWDLHDSSIKIENAKHLKIKTKYTDFKMNEVGSIALYSHDDDFVIHSIDDLNITESKYSSFEVRELTNSLEVDYSHDDDFVFNHSSNELSILDFNGTYSDLRLPLPSSRSYNLKGTLKYGYLKYPKDGIEERRYIKDNDDLEIEGVAADGSEALMVNIKAHDCKIDLKHY